jgi:putative ABC transport system permease protein
MVNVTRVSDHVPAIRGHARRLARAIDSRLPVAEIRTMTDIAAGALARPRLTTWLLAGFAALALALAAIGIYGTSALLVSDRAQEIGIRLALGAPRATILRLVLARGVALAAAGIAGGVVAALSLTNLLYGVTPLDPLTFVASPRCSGASRCSRAWYPHAAPHGWTRCARSGSSRSRPAGVYRQARSGRQ